MKSSPYVSTTNACKLCRPLGACLAFRGIEGAVPLLHGSQGCATYMRRYIISHFREPMDIASSSLGEKHAVYGGGPNLKQAIQNVMTKFGAKVIGIATTCLTETIGDDVPGIVKESLKEIESQQGGQDLPEVVTVSTPSYSGTHMEGFHAAVRTVVEQISTDRHAADMLNLLPGLLSPEDLRHLKEIIDDFWFPSVILPDFSLTLDGPALEEYEKIPRGGAPVDDIRRMGGAKATIELGRTLDGQQTAGSFLSEHFNVPLHRMGIPIGIRETDVLFSAMEQLTGSERPAKYALERGRLVDSYVDAHKYLFGKRAVVYGEEDLVVGLTSFLAEVGVQPVLCASGGKSGGFEAAIAQVSAEMLTTPPAVKERVDFYEIEKLAEDLVPDFLVGHSKGYTLARKLGIPLIRVGFPIHDRFGGQRILHVGYRGTQSLLDRVVNAIIEQQQEASPVGYAYM
jgi:nitrogenase molybdenum-iron protein NifN